jgi:hypothetical protein
MNHARVLAATIATLCAADPAAIAAQDDPESLGEQDLARLAERRPGPAWTPGPLLPALDDAATASGAGPSGSLPEGVLIGVDDVAVSVHVVDPVSAAATPVFSGTQVWGAAYVAGPGAGLVFTNNGSQLNVSAGAVPPVPCCTLSIDGVSPASAVGMAWDPLQQRLLFSRNIGSEEIHALTYSPTLCTAAPICTMVPVAAPVAATADLDGLAFAPETGTLYASNDTAALRGVVSVDLGTGALTVVAPYPAGQTDIDGLAYHAGRLYLVTDEPGDIFVYDLAQAAYVTPLANPWTTSEVFSAGAFVGFDSIFANGFESIPVTAAVPSR